MTRLDAPSATAGGPSRSARRPRLRPVLTWSALLVAAWLIPLSTHFAKVDILLPPLVLVATASLLRVSDGLLDRLVLALGLLVGLSCAAGLVFSVWPWHLHPVPIAGAACTVLVLFALATGRRPRLRIGRDWRADLGILAGSLLSLVMIAKPFVGGGLYRRLDLVMLGEDLSRLYNSFDATRAVGGYPFFHTAIGGVSLSDRMLVYPSGSTFVTAMLDSFLRSSTAQGAPVSAFTHFIAFFILSYPLMSGCVVWAADWVARPFLHGWRRAALIALTSAACALSTLVSLFVCGFISEIFGLALLAPVFAILIRPPRVTREYLVIVTALTIGVSFCYYLFLPVVLVAALVTAVSVRRRLWRVRGTTVLAVLIGGPLAAVPFLITFAGHSSEAADQLVLPGTAIGTNYNLTLGAVFAVLAAAVLRRRSPSMRRAGTFVAVMAVFTAVVGVYSVIRTDELGHYFNKSTHALFVTCLVTSGVVVSLLPGERLARGQRRAAAVLATLAALAGYGLVALPPNLPTPVWAPPAQVSWGASFSSGNLRTGGNAAYGVERGLATLPVGYDRPTVVVVSSGTWYSYLATKFLSVLRRDGNSVDDWSSVPLDGTDADHLIKSVKNVKVKKAPAAVRIVVVQMPKVAADLTRYAQANPSSRLEVVALN